MTTPRDEVAEILEQIAKEGMPHPRNLDAALDAIEASYRVNEMKRALEFYEPGLIRKD